MIGDALGTYVDAGMSFKETRNMTVARILVLLYLWEGLMSDIFLNTVVGFVIHDLDYEGVPLRCHTCHSEDHLVAQCHFPFHGHLSTKGRKEWSRDGGSLKKVREAFMEKRSSKVSFGSLYARLILREVKIREFEGDGAAEADS